MQIMAIAGLRHTDIDKDQFVMLRDQSFEARLSHPSGKGAAVVTPIGAHHQQKSARICGRAREGLVNSLLRINGCIIGTRFGMSGPRMKLVMPRAATSKRGAEQQGGCGFFHDLAFFEGA